MTLRTLISLCDFAGFDFGFERVVRLRSRRAPRAALEEIRLRHFGLDFRELRFRRRDFALNPRDVFFEG